MHTGPSKDYRILGSVDSGNTIEVLDTSGDYTKIRDDRNREGWVLSKWVRQGDSLQVQLEKLQLSKQTELAELQQTQQQLNEQLGSEQQTLQSRDNQILELQQQSDALQQQLTESKQQQQALQDTLDSYQDAIKIEWMLKGGGLVGAGLLFGLLVPFFPRRKKRNPNHW